MLEKERSEYLNLLHIKKDLKATLQELVNYRQSIDYDHKYKQIKFDHYRFPYSDNLQLKQQLNNARLENVDKRRKIKEMEQELKRKQQHIDQVKLQKQNYTFAAVRDTPTESQKVAASEDFWVKRIENIKSRYLSSDNEYKRAKIRHDYNLLVEKDGCQCVGMRVCPLCSDLNYQTKRNSYTAEALLSPRYDTIYRGRKFF